MTCPDASWAEALTVLASIIAVTLITLHSLRKD